MSNLIGLIGWFLLDRSRFIAPFCSVRHKKSCSTLCGVWWGNVCRDGFWRAMELEIAMMRCMLILTWQLHQMYWTRLYCH